MASALDAGSMIARILNDSAFARGIDRLNATCNSLDLIAKGRDETPATKQAWVRYHDRY